MKVVFAGTPLFADHALQALVKSNINVVGVFTQPDRPSGRGLKLTPSPVKQTAVAHNIAVFQPRSLKLDGKYPDDAHHARDTLTQLKPDIMVVAAYGLILPQWTLDIPRIACLNLHASLLPRWRGAAPIQRAIAAGDTQTGVCLMHMELGLDTGAVYAQQTVEIGAQTTGGQLHDELCHVGAHLLMQHLPSIASGALVATPQSTIGVNYAHKLHKTDGVLDFSQPASELALTVRAFDPTPGCSFVCQDETYKVWAAYSKSPTPQAIPIDMGTVVNINAAGLEIACAQGVLCVTEIQKPGGKRLHIKDAWQGLMHLKSMVCQKAHNPTDTAS